MQKIIVMLKDEDKELNMSLYDFIDEQYRKNNPIMVCYVTHEEYGNMKKQIKLGYLNERLSRITGGVEQVGYNKFRYVVLYDNIEENLLISDYDNPEKMGNYTIDLDGIHYNKDGYQATNYPDSCRFMSHYIKVYTTETYDDIIAHYTKNSEDIIQEKTDELVKLIGKSCKTCNTECCGGPSDRSECSKWSHIIY